MTKEGYLNDSKPTIYEEDFVEYLKSKSKYNFNLLRKSEDKIPLCLTEEEAKNEIVYHLECSSKGRYFSKYVSFRLSEIYQLLQKGYYNENKKL